MWFTEDPWPPLLGCVLAALGLFGLWRTTPKALYLKGIAAVALLGGAIVGIEQLIVTPAEQIEADVHDMVDAFQHHDRRRTLRHISKSAKVERELVSKAIGMVDVEGGLRVKDMTVTVLDGKMQARARFRVNGTADFQGSERRVSTRWELTFEREDDDWKVTRIERLKLLSDETVDPMNVSEI